MDFTIEELTINAWPSLQTILLDGWIIRMAGGYTKRANSVNPIYSFENNMDEKINYCENIFKQSNLPVIYKIIECEEHKTIDKALEELNYQKIDLTSVQICDELKQNENRTEQLFIDEKFTEDWKNCFYSCSSITNMETKTIIENLLKNIRHSIISVHKKERGAFAGCGYGVIEKGFVGLFDIIVNKNFRSRGYGKEIVEAILARAKDAGAKKAHLAVVDDNVIAKNLYGKLGFREIYKYWYRKKDFEK